MQPPDLADGHLPRLEPRLFLFIHQFAHQHFFAELCLLRKPVCVDRAQPVKECTVALQMRVVGGNRVVAQLVVVALIA